MAWFMCSMTFCTHEAVNPRGWIHGVVRGDLSLSPRFFAENISGTRGSVRGSAPTCAACPAKTSPNSHNNTTSTYRISLPSFAGGSALLPSARDGKKRHIVPHPAPPSFSFSAERYDAPRSSRPSPHLFTKKMLPRSLSISCSSWLCASSTFSASCGPSRRAHRPRPAGYHR